MAKSAFQKLKILYVMEYLLKNSDEAHPVSANQIIEHLASHGIAAERKSIYSDIEALRDYGIDIEHGSDGYFVASREFELPELKLLVDSVQSSKFITQKKTYSLIKKLENLASVYDAQLLNRQVYVNNRIKTMNESIYYNVDAIHSGIAADRQIRFHYFEYTVAKERHFRHDKAWYVISPFALTWDDENYYMVGFDHEAGHIKHFRVDKMTDIETAENERAGKDAYAALDMAVYARKVFGMFSGDETRVQLRFDNTLVGAVLDRLGRDVMLVPDGDAHFTVSANVVVSPQFFAWVCGFGDKVKIIGPQEVIDQMTEHIRAIAAVYGVV